MTDYRPLADRVRPVRFDQYGGQEHIVGEGCVLRDAIDRGRLHSMVFWGPPGTGKTTLARLIAEESDASFIQLSAVLSGVKDIRDAVDRARQIRAEGRATILFVDEVHRFNKSQQDAFLPFVEDGTVFFIGATTENPSFQLNNALLSRVKTYVLKRLEVDAIMGILEQALAQDVHLSSSGVIIGRENLEILARAADGDARRALNFLEIACELASGAGSDECSVTSEIVENVISQTLRRFDKGGESFYDQISALHKSVRGSSPDAALYWYARMVDGGCDIDYIARRVVRMASEDIGNADPRALNIAIDAWHAYERLGSPEGELAMAQAIVYLASTAKSNAAYTAFKLAMKDAKERGSLDVPLHLRNAPTKLMKELDYGKGYRYAHDEAGGFAAGETYFPDEMGEQVYYEPVERGMEVQIAEKLRRLRRENEGS